MPTIDNFNGIKINIYNGEHRPPHIHAVYNEYEVLMTIENGIIYAGNMPSRQLKLISDWLSLNSQWALNVFFELNKELV